MITASEANKKTTQYLAALIDNEMQVIEVKITEAIQNGNYSISESGYISKPVQEALRQLGFEVETDNPCNDPYYSISWE